MYYTSKQKKIKNQIAQPNASNFAYLFYNYVLNEIDSEEIITKLYSTISLKYEPAFTEELIFYKNKKKTKIDHTIYLETQRHHKIKNQFYASGLNFFYYNLALNSIDTEQFITKIYRTDNAKKQQKKI